jgi:flagellar biosynthesis protein FliP
MADTGKKDGRLWMDSWYNRVGRQTILNWYNILSVFSGIALLLAFSAFSHYLGYPAWEGNNIIVILSMSLLLILLFLGIPFFMNRARDVFSFTGSQEPDSSHNEAAKSLEIRFRQKKDRYAIIILVILPFLFLNIVVILQHGTIFYGGEGTPAALLLDIINYGAGYLILYLFAVVLWIVYVIYETLRDIRETPLGNTVPLDINAIDNLGGLGTLHEFILTFLTYYFVIVALLILSYLPPGGLWSFEMLFAVVVFLVGIFFFIPNLGTIHKLVRGKIMETDRAINGCIKDEQNRIQKLLSDPTNPDTTNEVSRIQNLITFYKDQHTQLQDLYKNNPAFSIRTLAQSFAALLLPVLAFLVEVTSQISTVMATVQGLLPPPS